jgi:hypothetical protein
MIMDTGTLIEVVKMIEARLAQEDLNSYWDNDDDDSDWDSEGIREDIFISGHIHGLREFRIYLQSAIEADVSALENGMGE